MKTRRIILLSIFFITAGAQGMKAQDYSVTVPDGPVVSPDSLSFKPLPSFLLSTPSFRPLQQADRLFSPLGIETKEQRAARINQQTFNAAMLSVDRNLYWHRPQKIPKQWMPSIFESGIDSGMTSTRKTAFVSLEKKLGLTISLLASPA